MFVHLSGNNPITDSNPEMEVSSVHLKEGQPKL